MVCSDTGGALEHEGQAYTGESALKLMVQKNQMKAKVEGEQRAQQGSEGNQGFDLK